MSKAFSVACRPGVWACLFVSAMLGCGSGDSPTHPDPDPGPQPAAVARVVVNPTAATVEVSDTVNASAAVQDAGGRTLTGHGVTWSVENTAVATVSAGGTIVAVGPGTSRVLATSEGMSGTLTLTVTPAAVAALRITPGTADVTAGTTVQLTATATDKHANVLTGRAVTWASSNPDVAAVDAAGLVTGKGEGAVTITATSEGRQATASLAVSKAPVARLGFTTTATSLTPGQTATLALVAYDAAGNVLAGRPGTISTSDTSVATVADKTVTARAPGTAVLTAHVEGASATLTVTVGPAPVARLAFTAAKTTLVPGETVALSLAAYDAAGNVLASRPGTIVTSDTTVVTVGANKTATGRGPGIATLTARVEGVSESLAITVGEGKVARLTLAPSASTVPVGGTIGLTLTAYDAVGNVLAGRPATLVSANAAVATVDSTRTVHGVSAGSATITATCEGVSASTTVRIMAYGAPAAAAIVSGNEQTVKAGKPLPAPLVVKVTDAYGNAVANAVVSWRAAWMESVGSVTSAQGLAQLTPTLPTRAAGYQVAFSAGAAAQGSFSLTVTPSLASKLAIAPKRQAIAIGESVAFTVTAADEYGNALPTTDARWAGTAGGHATLTAGGVVTGVSRGLYILGVQSNGIVASDTIHVYQGPDVTPPVVDSLDVFPDTIDTRYDWKGLYVLPAMRETQSWIGAVGVTLRSPSGTLKNLRCALDDPDALPDTREAFTYTCYIAMAKGSEGGVWTVDSLSVSDGVGNTTTLTHAQLASATGWDSSFVVIGP